MTEFYLHNGLKVLKLLDIVEESLAFKNCLSLMSLLSPYFHEVYPKFEKTPHALRDMKAKKRNFEIHLDLQSQSTKSPSHVR